MKDDAVDNRYTRKAARDSAHYEARGLAERIVDLREEWFEQLPLDDEDPRIGEQLRLARRLKASGARKRIVQYVARLMKDVELAPIFEALEAVTAGHVVETAAHHVAEAWRDRIVAEGDEAVEEFLAEYPEADRQQLRQLCRQAQKERDAKSSPKAARAIYRAVHAVIKP